MAKRFRFRLETVQKMRERERDVQRRALAERLRAIDAVQQRIATLNRGLTDDTERLRKARPVGPMDVSCIRLHLIHRGWLHHSVRAAHEEMTQRQTEVGKERGRLADASKRLRVIEKLRERQWARHRAAAAREEQASMDEAALHLHLRRSRRERATS